MKKQLPFLITFFVVLIFMIFVAPVLTPVFADGSYIDSVYSYSISIKTPSNNVIILQCKNPIFVSSLNKGVYVNGDYRAYQIISNTNTPSFTNSTVAIYTLQYTYSEILESSADIFDFYTKAVIFQSEETDNVVITNQVVQEFRDFFILSNSKLTDINNKLIDINSNVSNTQSSSSIQFTDNMTSLSSDILDVNNKLNSINNLLASIYVFIAFAITICAGGFVIYLVLKPVYYFIR